MAALRASNKHQAEDLRPPEPSLPPPALLPGRAALRVLPPARCCASTCLTAPQMCRFGWASTKPLRSVAARLGWRRSMCHTTATLARVSVRTLMSFSDGHMACTQLLRHAHSKKSGLLAVSHSMLGLNNCCRTCAAEPRPAPPAHALPRLQLPSAVQQASSSRGLHTRCS